MAKTRRYRLEKRARRQQETRRRIIEAAVELHRTVGPAATSVSEVARRSGVQRMTVYNHFPDQAALFAACSEHWRSLHPAPYLGDWEAIDAPLARVEHGLRQLYGWYRESEAMTANVLRDAEAVPALRRALETGLLAYLERVRAILRAAFRVPDERRPHLDAAVTAVVDFPLWRSLKGLGDAEAARLATAFVAAAVDP